ncbi:MAG: ribosome maturation factor RimM [Bacteroidia bacterium]|jgi:16S rRNA processing protein RimM|nr:ribosome maturation factor RimM [Bacteroidia bacterium]
MKSIARKDFIAVGTIDKTHGTKGELRITLSSNKQFKEWAFLEIQGKPVPFKIVSFSPTFDDGALLKLNTIDTIEQASSFVGYTLLLPKGKRQKGEVYSEDDFTGFKLVDETLGNIGEVESIEEFPNQLLIKTTYKGNEVLIPAVEAFIEEIDEAERVIYLNLPEGLI